MLDIQLLRTDLEGVAQRLAARGFTFDTGAFQSLEQERKTVQTRTQELQAKRNATSKSIGQAKAKGEDVSAIMAEVAGLGDELKAAEAQLEKIQAAMQDILLTVPNLPNESVPAGKSEADNVEVRKLGHAAPASTSRCATMWTWGRGCPCWTSPPPPSFPAPASPCCGPTSPACTGP